MFRLEPAAEDEVRRRLGHQEADAFLARLDHLSFDMAEPLELRQPRCVRSTTGDPVTGAGRIELPAWGLPGSLARDHPKVLHREG